MGAAACVEMMDAESAEHLWQCHAQLYRTALSHLHQHQDAEDAAQEALLHAWRSWQQFEHRSDVKTWLHRITVRCCIDVMRTRARRPEWLSDDVQPGTSEDPGATALDNLAAARLRQAVSGLPLGLRTPMTAHALRGETMDGVARQLRIPVGTVKSRLFRARQVLRERLGRDLFRAV